MNLLDKYQVITMDNRKEVKTSELEVKTIDLH